MLTIEETKKALDAGEIVYLEHNVRGKALNELYFSELEKLEVGYVNINENGLRDGVYIKYGSGHARNSSYFIPKEDLKYFRIKRPAPTFDDLIDAATQAWKDGYLKVLEFERGVVEQIFTVVGEDALRWHDGDSDYNHAVDLIKSLYTETFVIKSEGDINLFKSQVESIVLANGEDIINDVMFHKNTPYFTNGGVSAVKVGFNVLKGATVTQKRGVL